MKPCCQTCKNRLWAYECKAFPLHKSNVTGTQYYDDCDKHNSEGTMLLGESNGNV